MRYALRARYDLVEVGEEEPNPTELGVVGSFETSVRFEPGIVKFALFEQGMKLLEISLSEWLQKHHSDVIETEAAALRREFAGDPEALDGIALREKTLRETPLIGEIIA